MRQYRQIALEYDVNARNQPWNQYGPYTKYTYIVYYSILVYIITIYSYEPFPNSLLPILMTKTLLNCLCEVHPLHAKHQIGSL